MTTFELKIEKNFLYYPVTNSYFQLVNFSDPVMMKPLFINNFKPGFKVTAKFHDRDASLSPFSWFLFQELYRDFIYTEFSAEYTHRKTELIQEEFIEKAREITANNKRVEESLVKLSEMLKELKVNQVVADKKSIAVDEMSEHLLKSHPEYKEIPDSWYQRESILISGPRFEIYCHEDTQIYQVLRVAGFIPEKLCSSSVNCDMIFLRRCLELI